MRLKVQFLHGLESNSQGSKARYLAERFDTLTPAMDTRDFEACVAVQREALESFRPEVLVGSSFGGALATRLIENGSWRGPTVLLAPASIRYGQQVRFPSGIRVVVVCALEDELIPVSDCEALVRAGDPRWVTRLDVQDGHRLASLLEGERLAELVRGIAR